MILTGPYNVGYNTRSSTKLLIADFSNDAGDDMYPVYVEDENNQVNFMIFIDTRTVLISYIISNVICASMMITLRRQNRRRSPELFF